MQGITGHLGLKLGRELSPQGPSDPREAEGLMRGVGVAMFLLGSMTLLATLPLPDPITSDRPAIEAVAALLGVGALFVWLLRPNRRWVSRVAVVYALVSALMAVTRPIESTPFFYLWPMVYSAYFFSRREAALDLVLMWVTLALALFVWSDDAEKAVLFIGVGTSVTLTTAVVRMLGEHVSAVIGQLARTAATDYLTGLLNRRSFDEQFLGQIDRARRSQLPLALVLLDLDHFKQVNDRHGHAAGDDALRDFADLLERELRGGDTLARIGGEEFAVVLFGVELEAACAYAERIGRKLHTRAGDGPVLSLSAGVAGLGDSEDTPSTLLLAADRALYGAKRAGRCRVAVWDQGSITVGMPMDGLEKLTADAA
jgi:diguanylate cyclase (GGDEF)-like protein